MFYNPMLLSATTQRIINSNRQMELSMSIGSKVLPDYPIRSQDESSYHIRKTLGMASGAYHNVDIIPEEWSTCKFVYCTDCEKVPEVSWSGMNTKSGDVINLKLKQGDVVNGIEATNMFVTLHSDQIMKITASGVEVFD